jgi:hypothetical protein
MRFSTNAPHADAFLGLAFGVALAGCGGNVEAVPDSTVTDRSTPPSRRTPPSNSDAPSTAPPVSASVAAACNARPQQATNHGLDSCAIARTSTTVDVTGVAWADPALAWKQGGRAWLEVRYANHSETESIEYPGMLVSSSDGRATTDTEAHGDPAVHPDLYALGPCVVYDSRDHGFTLSSDIPTGTRLTFTLSPAVATGSDISSCDGSLRRSRSR